MPSAEAIARYLLLVASQEEEAAPLTHMQLHKLLYYAQGWTLVDSDRPLFDDEIQAWRHGPVVSAMYPAFVDYGSNPIAWHEARDDQSLTARDRQQVEYAWRSYGRYSAWRLREMTHIEPPWRDARAGLPDSAKSRAVITDAAMKKFFGGLRAAKLNSRAAAELRESLEQARSGHTSPFPLT